MTDLDKKAQKAQPTDLVQSVLEAFEKRNSDRVDVLISNAIKQLKMSRFKPDHATCLGLIYLARVNPKVFAQSSSVKELLKTHIRRDNGPTSLKGAKNDIILPVLAANILLACCDTREIKTIILHRMEQWLSSSQKPAEMVLNLLVVLSMKSQGDQQTIATLIEMRQRWLPYFHENSLGYCRVPNDLCAGIRNLLHSETCCESIINNLKFLIRYDHDITGLAREVSRFMIERPISVAGMLNHNQLGEQLIQMLLRIYNKLFEQLGADSDECSNINPPKQEIVQDADSSLDRQRSELTDCSEQPVVKCDKDSTKPNTIEPKTIKIETKPNVENNAKKQNPKADLATTNSQNDGPTRTINIDLAPPPLYIRLPTKDRVVAVDRITIEAVLTLLASINLEDSSYQAEFKDLLDCWLIDIEKSASPYIYEDFCMTTPHYLSSKVRQMLVHSDNNYLIGLGLHCADAEQLIELLQQFGLPLSTLNKITNKLATIQDTDNLIASTLMDSCYSSSLMDYYANIGVNGINQLTTERLGAKA